MLPLAVASPSAAGNLNLVGGHGDGVHGGAVQEQVQLSASGLTPTGLDHQRSLQQGRCRHEADRIGLDGLSKATTLRFVEQHRDDRRRVENHQRGSPASS